MKKILFIGPAPQNVGGISMHIRRLSYLIKDEFDIDYIDEGKKRYAGVFNMRSLNVIKYISKIQEADIVHIHSGHFLLRFLHIMLSSVFLKKRTIVTIHRDLTIESHLKLTIYALSLCQHVIMVNKNGFDNLNQKSNVTYHYLPAFIPPVMKEEDCIPRDVSKWIENVRLRDNVKILVSNAWKLDEYKGEDLYGLDQCLLAMRMLRDENNKNDFCLIFVIANPQGGEERIGRYEHYIRDWMLENNVLIWKKPMSFVRLISESDLVLRTTNTDGDALSIREALYMRKPVIASDIVERPQGTILYKTRDAENLAKVINNYFSAESIFIKNTNLDVDYKKLYLDIYR